MVPWRDLSIYPTGEYGFCCAEDQSLNQDRMLATQPWQMHWNSDRMSYARLAFAQGKIPNSCQSCIRNESVAVQSRRHRMNQRYLGTAEPGLHDPLVKDLLSQTDSLGHTSAMPWGIDLAIGNTCQLRCVTCSPSYSRSILKDYEKLGWQFNEKNRLPIKNISDTMIRSEDLLHIIEQIKPLIPNLKWLKIFGGEPSLSRPLADLLDWCIENDHAKNLMLIFSTNAVNVKDEFIQRCKKFKRVFLAISVDGIGGLDEYIRFPTSWPKKVAIIENLMATFPDAYVYTVAFSLNIHQLDEIINWCRQRGYRHMIERLNYPNELAIEHLPESDKQVVADKLLAVTGSAAPVGQDRQLVDQDMLKFLHSTVLYMLQTPRDANKWNRCLDIVRSYDRIRSTSLGQHNTYFHSVSQSA